jgi:hypothetical protein
MIRNIEFDLSPIDAGATRDMVVRGRGPFVIELKCFVQNPPPPGYKPCRECGTIRAQDGESVLIKASAKSFASGGTLSMTVTDRDGDARDLNITVLGRTIDSTPSLAQA